VAAVHGVGNDLNKVIYKSRFPSINEIYEFDLSRLAAPIYLCNGRPLQAWLRYHNILRILYYSFYPQRINFVYQPIYIVETFQHNVASAPTEALLCRFP